MPFLHRDLNHRKVPRAVLKSFPEVERHAEALVCEKFTICFCKLPLLRVYLLIEESLYKKQFMEDLLEMVFLCINMQS
jgi:hypothetical protein